MRCDVVHDLVDEGALAKLGRAAHPRILRSVNVARHARDVPVRDIVAPREVVRGAPVGSVNRAGDRSDFALRREGHSVLKLPRAAFASGGHAVLDVGDEPDLAPVLVRGKSRGTGIRGSIGDLAAVLK